MKFFLLTVAILVASAAAAPGKVKRDILPGDSRYGTEYHLQHQHAHSINSVGSGYLPPVQSAPAPAPQVNNQYLAPAPVQHKQSLQVPSTSYGVPFSKNAQVNNQYLAPATQSAPITSYGTPVQAPQNVYVPAPAPVVHHQPAPQVVHHQAAPVVHHQPAPVYGPPAHQPAPVVHHHPAPVVHHQPAPQVAHYQPAPQIIHHQPAPQVHYHPAPQQNLVYEAPVPSIEVSQSHTIETVPSSVQFQTDSVSVESGSSSYSQQQTDSNGGYVY